MEEHLVYAKALTPADCIVLRNLEKDIQTPKKERANNVFANAAISDSRSVSVDRWHADGTATCLNGKTRTDDGWGLRNDSGDMERLRSFNDPAHHNFKQAVFLSVDTHPTQVASAVSKYMFQSYIGWARKIVRHEADVVMLTHLIMYFTTSVPSALLLYWHFTYMHGFLHAAMQFYYVGTYTLMMHQHIHMRGILAKRYAFVDHLFPYITDPLMGHTWNGYFYHHVKHHHVEGNGPDDLSSTIRYQRDNVLHFIHYLGRFFFLIWLDLPLYFLRKSRPALAVQAAGSELLTYAFYYAMATWVNPKATFFVFLSPLLLLRLGLMVGNWGQHAFVDPDEPDSDYRSSITLIDASNRFCFNDGYHTSHHLNPLRHWRQHPISFLEQRHVYANEGALVFHNIDYLMITFRLLCKDYHHLAKRLVPIGEQIDLTLEQRVRLLRKLTRKFTEEEIRQKFQRQT